MSKFHRTSGVFVILVGMLLIQHGRADEKGDADQKAKTAQVVKRVVEAVGGKDKLMKLFQIKEQLKVYDLEGNGFERISVLEPPKYWWVDGEDRMDEPAKYLVWAWTLGALNNPESKLTELPEIKEGDVSAYGLRVSGTIDPPLDMYFDKKDDLLLRIDWRDDFCRFSEWKEADGLKYPSRAIGFKKNDEKPWYQSDILELTRLTEAPEGLSRK